MVVWVDVFMSSNIVISYSHLDVSTKVGAAHCFIESLHAMESNYTMMFVDFKQLIKLREICDQVVDIQWFAIIGCLKNVRIKPKLTMYKYLLETGQ